MARSLRAPSTEAGDTAAVRAGRHVRYREAVLREESRYGLLASGLAGLQPPSERALCLARRPAGEKARNVNIFVEIGPMDAFASPDQAPIRAFGRRPMCKAGVPRQGHAHTSTVDKVDDQGIVRDRDVLGDRRPQVTR
jgi:hypothetical protein